MFWTELRAFRSFLARNPLALALGLSLFFHLTVYEGWKMGKRLGWWEHQATWLLDWKKKLHLQARPLPLNPALPLPAPREIPLSFVEVDPSVATPEPPKDAKYYGAQSSRAANPDPIIETVAPKSDGHQTKVVRTEDVPKPGPQPLQPSIAPPEKPADPVPPKPKGGETPGDLAKMKPDQIRKPNDPMTEIGTGAAPVARERPRTLAKAREQRMLAGEKVKQDGGVRERGKFSLNVQATAFGSYDAALIAAVQQRWYDLLDSTQFSQRSGKVDLEFRLYYDGRITDMKIDGNEVGELLGLLCQRAVTDPAPFAPWPSDMRRAIGKNYRDVLFSFYYY